MYGNASTRPRLLVAGCVNGRRCAGTGVVNAAMIGCPPDDAELWYLPTLAPNGADLDATADHLGAAAWRQAVADLRPDTTIAFRTGPRAVVHAAGTGVAAGRRYARLAGLPFRRDPAAERARGLDHGRPARDRGDHRRAPRSAGLGAPGVAARLRDRPPRRNPLRGGRDGRSAEPDRARPGPA